jgi:hypothetical protein
MSGGTACHCPESKKPVMDRNWEVYKHRCNYSAFSGYHRTRSDYSALRCLTCHAVWRTKANYVSQIFYKNRSL